MNLQIVAQVGTQSPAILQLPGDVASLDEADDCIELAETYGPRLDEAQRITLRAWLGTTADGLWAAPLAAHAMPRQNGKGDELQARELFGLVALGETIIHTSHELATSVNAFNRLVATFDAYDDLRRLVKRVRLVNGEQGIDLRSGASIKYRARTGGGARGLDHIALVVYDEAQHLRAEHVAASSPTLATHPNSQVVMTGSAGLSFSEVWWSLRLDAVGRKPGRYAYVEHTAETVATDADGRFISTKPNPSDPNAWALANPAYGSRISHDFLESQLRLMGDELFQREHLGVWDALPAMTVQAGAKLPPDPWLDTVTVSPPDIQPGHITLAYDVEIDGSYAAIAIATGDLGNSYVEVVEHRVGTGWLPHRMVELIRRWEPTKVVMDGGSGAAAALLGEVRYELEKAAINPDRVIPLTTAEYRRACGAFLQAVVDGKVTRPAVENDHLNTAALTARARDIGDAWVFDRRRSPEPIVALTAAAMARAQLAEPTFDFFLM